MSDFPFDDRAMGGPAVAAASRDAPTPILAAQRPKKSSWRSTPGWCAGSRPTSKTHTRGTSHGAVGAAIVSSDGPAGAAADARPGGQRGDHGTGIGPDAVSGSRPRHDRASTSSASSSRCRSSSSPRQIDRLAVDVDPHGGEGDLRPAPVDVRALPDHLAQLHGQDPRGAGDEPACRAT